MLRSMVMKHLAASLVLASSLRARLRGVAVLRRAVAFVGACALAGCGGQSAGSLSGGREGALGVPRWQVDASMLQTASQPLTACYVSLLSLPPAGCSGAKVVGVSANRIPGTTKYPNGTVTTPVMHLVGTYRDGVLTLTEPPTRSALVSPSPAKPDPPVRCRPPAGGWPFAKVNAGGVSRVVAYVNAQRDGGSPRIDKSQKIMIAPFTGELERHRRELAAVYDGPVCVELAGASQRELAALEEQVSDEVKQKGFGLLSGQSSNAFGTAVVEVVAASDRDREAVAQEHPGLVEVKSFLKPIA